MDIVWFFVMQSVWSNRPENDYWKSLAGLQTLALVLCWVEIAIKLLIFFYLFVDYKDKNPEDVNDLLTLNYSKAKTRQENRGATASHDDEFRNPYAN